MRRRERRERRERERGRRGTEQRSSGVTTGRSERGGRGSARAALARSLPFKARSYHGAVREFHGHSPVSGARRAGCAIRARLAGQYGEYIHIHAGSNARSLTLALHYATIWSVQENVWLCDASNANPQLLALDQRLVHLLAPLAAVRAAGLEIELDVVARALDVRHVLNVHQRAARQGCTLVYRPTHGASGEQKQASKRA